MIKKNSLSFRIITRVLLITSILFVLTVAAYYLFSRKIVRENARENAVQLAENLAGRVNKELVGLEKIPMTLGSALNLHLLHEDSIPVMLEKILAQNKNIFGVAISFEPYHVPGKGRLYAPYTFRCIVDKDSLVRGFIDYEYFLRDWYQIPRVLEKPYWSEPYYSEIDHRVLMASYSFPFYREKDGRDVFSGVVTIDVSLDWLTEIVSEARIFDTGYAFMVSRNGVALAHPVRTQIVNESVFSSAEEWNAPMLREIGRDIIAGRTDFRKYNRGDDYHLYMYHTSLPSSRWSIGVVYPEREMFGPLQQMNTLMIVLVVGGLLILGLLTVQNINRITSPLGQFAESAHLIAEGDFNVTLPDIRSKDEMHELHGAFSHMQQQLAQYVENLKETTSAKEKIESELRIAHQIQMSMIPHSFPPFPDTPQVDLFATLNSAREVGGDLYDFFIMDDDKFCFAIGDVSGKGVPASLFMAVTRTLLRSIADKTMSAAEITNTLNKSLALNNESCMFVTFFMGVLDLKSGEVQYVNAGHNPPVLITKDDELKSLESGGSIPLGLVADYVYKEQQLRMEAGDKIFAYTDGVNEAENAKAQLFGDDNMLQVVSKHKELDPRKLIKAVEDAVIRHVAGFPQSDDITMLTIAYNGNMDNKRSITLENNIEELRRISNFLEECAEAWSLSMPLTMSLNLVLEEAFTNIVQYGYNDKGKREIELLLEKKGQEVMITLIDDGQFFDPTAQEDPDTGLAVEDRPIGGLGIFLIRKTMDDISYYEKGGKNHLVMTKKIQ